MRLKTCKNENTFTGFFLILSVLSLEEFYRLLKNTDVKPNKALGLILAALLFITISVYYLMDESLVYTLTGIPFMFLIIVSELYRNKPNPFHNIAYTLFGVLFAALPFCFFYAIAFTGEGYSSVYPLGFLILLFSTLLTDRKKLSGKSAAEWKGRYEVSS